MASNETNHTVNIGVTGPGAVKPGYKSSEFWLTLFVHLLTAFVAAGILPETHVAVKVASFALSALAHLGYTSARAKLKAGDAAIVAAGILK